MKRPENDKWLDELLSEAIGSKKSEPDFEKWQQSHSEAVEMLTSRAGRGSSADKRPLDIWRIIMRSRISKFIFIGAGPAMALPLLKSDYRYTPHVSHPF